MGRSGGKKKQKQAKKSPRAEDTAGAKQTSKECPLKPYLEVVVLRSDTDGGVEGVTVKAKPADGAALSAVSVKDTGLADFGEVAPNTYDVTLELTEDQKKRFLEPEQSSATVAEKKRKRHTVTLDPICELRIIVLGYDAKGKKDEPISGRDWKFTAPVNESGKTKKDGPIKIAVLADDDTATLEVKLRDPPAPAAADPAVVSKPEDYPIKIKPDTWKDTDAEKVLPPREDDTVKWKLTIIDLEDADNDDGIRGRLHNLAFPTDSGAEAEPTERAVKAYQLLYEDERDGSGALSDVKDAVKTKHDAA